MSANEKIRAFALDAVGCAYIYGATGQKCTPDYRRARAEQYPGYADKIRSNCPVLSGKADCTGCKYNGKKAYDCAQLTRYAAKAADLTLPSGASSQWNKGDWAQQGTIDTLPRGTVCFLYQEKASASPMGHTGVYLGDGTAVDARGHAAGVVHRALDDVKWTHWAMLRGMELTEDGEKEETAMMKYKVTGTRLALREKPTTGSAVLLRMDTGTIAEGEAHNAEWVKITYGGKVGYSMAKYLQAMEPVEPAPAPDESAEITDAEKLDRLWAWYLKETGGGG